MTDFTVGEDSGCYSIGFFNSSTYPGNVTIQNVSALAGVKVLA